MFGNNMQWGGVLVQSDSVYCSLFSEKCGKPYKAESSVDTPPPLTQLSQYIAAKCVEHGERYPPPPYTHITLPPLQQLHAKGKDRTSRHRRAS